MSPRSKAPPSPSCPRSRHSPASPTGPVPTGQRGVSLAALGAHTVLPAHVGVLHVARQVLEELAKGHARGTMYRIVEQRRAPQEGLLAEQHAVQAGQALLCGVRWPQPVLLPALGAVPRLPRVVHAPKVVGTCRVGKEEAGLGIQGVFLPDPVRALLCLAGPLAGNSHSFMPLESGSHTSLSTPHPYSSNLRHHQDPLQVNSHPRIQRLTHINLPPPIQYYTHTPLPNSHRSPRQPHREAGNSHTTPAPHPCMPISCWHLQQKLPFTQSNVILDKE